MLLSNFVAVPCDTHAIRRDSRGDAVGWDASGGRVVPETGRAVRALVASALGLALTFGTGLVEAEEAPPPRVEDRSGMSPSTTVERAVDESERAAGAGEPRAAEREDFARPYGLVEFGVGIMALPDAKFCGGDAGCDRGDVSVAVDAWPLFRASPNFAVGAGMTLALIPMQEVPSVKTRFTREHARRYFTAEGIGRYYFLHGPALEFWGGISAGLIVVSDNFRTPTKDQTYAIIGAESANIATEGLSLGLGTGVTFGVNRHLQVGATLRFANWYLPPTPEVIAFDERASLSSRVTMLNLALTVAYHSH